MSLRARRACELGLLFGALPLVVALGRHGPWPELPVIPTLLVVGLLAGGALLREPGFDLGRELSPRADRGGLRTAELRPIALRFAAAGGALTLLVWLRAPESLLSFPREHPWLWALVMVGYPLLSVLPQELVFRTFFFRRYASIFRAPAAMVLASALAFGWVHVVFWNLPAILLTAVGGVFFGLTYRRTGSLWTVAFEHALYGWLVFTVGLEHLFYGGIVETLRGQH